MMHEPFAEWLALYALGALDGDELTRLEVHLSGGCRTCEDRLYELSAVAATLPYTLPRVPLRSEIRAGVMKRVTTDAVQRGAARRWPTAATAKRTAWLKRPSVRDRGRVWPWVGSALAAGLAGLLGWNLYLAQLGLTEQQAMIDELTDHGRKLAADLAGREAELAQAHLLRDIVWSKDARVVALAGTGAAARAEGLIVWSAGKKHGSFVVHFLPMLPPEKQYQLWVIAGGKTFPGGVFSVDEVGHDALVAQVEPERPDGFAITVEPAGGGSVPTGPVMMTNR
ncbi:MAG: anti-sigma factor domain-containing protein [Gammaproteobacteria bacterium]